MTGRPLQLEFRRTRLTGSACSRLSEPFKDIAKLAATSDVRTSPVLSRAERAAVAATTEAVISHLHFGRRTTHFPAFIVHQGRRITACPPLPFIP